MAYDEELAERIRGVLGDRPVVEKKMFGGLAFLAGGHMSVSASGQGGLLVRVDPADSDDLLSEPGAALMQMGNRPPMAGWLRVAPQVVEDDAVLERWVERGLAYARSLPPKR
jgi:TfoX/Sxy family transcriptional regulator of competence genes